MLKKIKESNILDYIILLGFYIIIIIFGVRIVNNCEISIFSKLKILNLTLNVILFIMTYILHKRKEKIESRFLIFIGHIIMACQISLNIGFFQGSIERVEKMKFLIEFFDNGGVDIISIFLMIFILISFFKNVFINEYFYIGIVIISFFIAGEIGTNNWAFVSLIIVFCNKLINFKEFYKLYLYCNKKKTYENLNNKNLCNKKKQNNDIKMKLKKLNLLLTFIIIFIYIFLKYTEKLNIILSFLEFMNKDKIIFIPNIVKVIFKGIERLLILEISILFLKKYSKKSIREMMDTFIIFIGKKIDYIDI